MNSARLVAAIFLQVPGILIRKSLKIIDHKFYTIIPNIYPFVN